MFTLGPKHERGSARDEPTRYDIHPGGPLPYGGGTVTFVERMPSPVALFKRDAGHPPINPGMPVMWHAPLQLLEGYRVIAPIPRHEPVDDGIRIAAGAASPTHPKGPIRSPFRPSPPAAPVPAATMPAPALPAVAPASVSPQSLLERLDPVFPLALYLAFSVGTALFLDVESRYTVLWAVMAVMGALLALVETDQPLERITLSELAMGAGFGFMIGLILFVMVAPVLADITRIVFPGMSVPAIVMGLLFAAPIGETLFFREVVQQRRGFMASVLAAGTSLLLLYAPAAFSSLPVLLAVGGFYTVMAGVYSFIRDQYGVAAAFVCQVMINMMLIVMPVLLIAPPERLP
ncbi:MAG: hypothetical protein IT326_05510 [Anaerolineae bacterium]|nr:hypothetical protein [Anaerolineae bacterium]